MTSIVELVHERAQQARQDLRSAFDCQRRKYILEGLHENCDEVANDWGYDPTSEFPEPGPEAPFGIAYWVTK